MDVPVMTIGQFFKPGEHFHMQVSTDFPDYVGVAHRHEYIEVVYVISGAATHVADEKSCSVRQGDLFVINVGTTHKFCPSRRPAEPFVVYDLMFTPEFFDLSLAGSRAMEALSGSFMFRSLLQGRSGAAGSFGVSGDLYTTFSELFHKMYYEYRNEYPGYMEIIRAYLLQVIITAIRLSDAAANKHGALGKKQAVQSVLRSIEQRCDAALSVQALADEVHLSPDYLGRIFKEATGQTITAHIQKVRVRRACELLAGTQRTVADIALACGFGDVKFFYSVFKKHTGSLPGDYRRARQG